MNLEELERILKQRRSVRKWQDKQVPEELLLKAIEVGSWAPSSGGRQPYHFYLVTNRDKIKELGQAVQDKVDLIASWPESQDYPKDLERLGKNSTFFARAPAVIIACTGSYQSPADKFLQQRPDDEDVKAMMKAREASSSRLQSAAAAVTQMLVYLHAQGLGAVWMSGPAIAKKQIEKVLGIPDGLDFAALIPVGYPAEEPEPRDHKPIEELVTVVRA